MRIFVSKGIVVSTSGDDTDAGLGAAQAGQGEIQAAGRLGRKNGVCAPIWTSNAPQNISTPQAVSLWETFSTAQDVYGEFKVAAMPTKLGDVGIILGSKTQDGDTGYLLFISSSGHIRMYRRQYQWDWSTNGTWNVPQTEDNVVKVNDVVRFRLQYNSSTELIMTALVNGNEVLQVIEQQPDSIGPYAGVRFGGSDWWAARIDGFKVAETDSSVCDSTPAFARPMNAKAGGYRIEGTKFVDNHGKTFIPRGLDVGGHQANGYTWPEVELDTTVIKYWRSKGTNIIRLTSYATNRYAWGWANSNVEWKGHRALEGMVAYFKEVVDAYRAQNIVVILEFHDLTDSPVQEDYIQQLEKAWQLVASAFKGQSDVWLNTANEPALSGDDWINFQRRMLKVIRGTGNTSIALLDAPYSGNDVDVDGKKSYQMAKYLRDEGFGNFCLSQHNYGWNANGFDYTDETQYRNYIKACRDAGFCIIHGEVGASVDGSGDIKNIAGALRAIATGRELGVGILWWAVAFNDGYKLHASRNQDFVPTWDSAPYSHVGQAFVNFLRG